MKKKILTVMILASSTSAFATEDYSNNIPSPTDSALYYNIGGGNLIPYSPSLKNTLSLGFDGLGALGYSCDRFNPNSSITNALNGMKNSTMNMFNSVVNSASGVIVSMPAYIFAKANPSLYEMMQNGLASGQFDLSLGMKSCEQQMSDVNSGNNPYQGMYDVSKSAKWKVGQYSSSSPRVEAGNMTYSEAGSGDVQESSAGIAVDDGSSGVPWVKGDDVDGSPHSGGDGQNPILMTNDIFIAGTNALLGRSEYMSNTSIPTTDSLSKQFKTPSDVVIFAKSVLGEKTIYTTKKQTGSSMPGRGLLPEMSKEYDSVFESISDMVTGSETINVDNLKNASAGRIMLNEDIIKQLRSETTTRRSLEASSLAQGIASIRVIDKAESLILILNAARQVPNILENGPAQETINQYIETLNQQIDLVIGNKEKSDKLLVSTIATMDASRQADIAQGNSITGGLKSGHPLIDGAISS